MSNEFTLNEKWIKASILGTIWASSEIVFGSFLHNLKIPFSGNILTGLGLILLISVSYRWKEKGLFWRASIVTAILKTVSPSAVIFGPMIAIIAEAFLLEITTRIFGRTILGYMSGAALAMSWNLFQKIANYLIFYGNNIVELYTKIIRIAQNQLHIQTDIVWLPILILLAIYFVLGILSAHIAIRIGRKLQKQTIVSDLAKREKNSIFQQNIRSDFQYSMTWMFVDLLFMLGSLALLSFSAWMYWSVIIVSIVIIWTYRYKRALRQIVRPKFWISFIIITMLITFVFNGDTSPGQRILIGVQMNFRAAIMILGFTVLGTELYNPKIRAFFNGSYFNQLSVALELAFESLPSAIANIPDFKSILKSPYTLLYQMTSQVESRLNEFKNKNRCTPKLFIISGAIGQGKTSCLQSVIRILDQEKVTNDGFYSLRVQVENKTIGYDLVDVNNNESEVLLRLNGENQYEKVGKFYIYPQGINKGTEILKKSITNNRELIIIDEIGRLEFDHKGWSNCLNEIMKKSESHILLTVRDIFIDEFMKMWNTRPVYLYPISEYDDKTISTSILKNIRK